MEVAGLVRQIVRGIVIADIIKNQVVVYLILNL